MHITKLSVVKKMQLMLKEWACATTLQKRYRGYLGRKRFKRIMERQARAQHNLAIARAGALFSMWLTRYQVSKLVSPAALTVSSRPLFYVCLYPICSRPFVSLFFWGIPFFDFFTGCYLLFQVTKRKSRRERAAVSGVVRGACFF